MAPLFTIVCFLLMVLGTLIGMVANGSIVLINFIDWLRSRKLSPTDLILISLGLSRLLKYALEILSFTLFVLRNITMNNNTMFILRIIWLFTNAMNLWLAACLSVFYLAKIAIFSHPLFLQFKRRFSGLVPWLLLGSMIASVVKIVFVTTSWNFGLYTCNYYKSLLRNRSYAEMNLPPVCRHMTILVYVFDFIPFIIFLSSSILLINSLWNHMRRVQGNGTGTKDINIQAHLNAIKTLASFAVLYLVSFAVINSQSILVSINQRKWRTVLYVVGPLYPSVHAAILIIINPKLKQAWVRMMHNFKCHLIKVPS